MKKLKALFIKPEHLSRNVAVLKSINIEKYSIFRSGSPTNYQGSTFWKEWDAKNGFPPLPPGWVERVKALLEAEQLAEIKAEIIKRNPGFEKDGVFKAEGIALFIVHSQLKDITPLAALTCKQTLAFTELSESGVPINPKPCALENIQALEKVPLWNLNLSNTQVTDITPIMESKLSVFSGSADFRDTPALAKMPLKQLYLGSKADDLTPCLGMPLESLTAPLETLKKQQGLERLKPTLKKINGKPADEFWKNVGK